MKILKFIVDEIRVYLSIDPFTSPDNSKCVTDIRLFVCGGDVKQSCFIHNALSTLNSHQLIDMNYDEDTHYLYKQLLNKVIILKSISKMLGNGEEADGTCKNKTGFQDLMNFLYSKN